KSKVPTHRALHRALADRYINVKYFTLLFLPLPRGIVLIHFPDAYVGSRSYLKMLVKLSVFIISILLTRLCRSPIVWEVNNIRSHEQSFPIFEKILMAIFTRSITGVIHNSESSVRQAIEAYPVLSKVP